MTAAPARRARCLSRAMARAARRARGSSRSPPSKSKALIMSMTRRALVGLERGIQGGGQRRLAAHKRAPGELQALALALGHQLEAIRGERQHVGLALDRDFAPYRLFELRCHSCPNSWTSAGSW